MSRGIRSSARGDTIVEVMISLLVISSILTGAFLVSRTSSRDIRSSQEHSEALQLLQGQVEMLRSLSTTDMSQITAKGSATFCLKASAGVIQTAATGSCDVGSGGYSYALAVVQSDPGSSSAHRGPTYQLSVQWAALGGGTNREALLYRLPVAS